jgi:hypothetical protein
MMLQCGIPNWIQAIAAMGIVALTLLTLIVLKKYASDTKTIANASISQLENSQMPFLAIVMRRSTRESDGGWGIQNQGFGPAVNVSYSGHGREASHTQSVEPLAKGATEAVHADIADAFSLKRPVVIEYESLSGLKYRTIVTMVDNVMQTQFHKP